MQEASQGDQTSLKSIEDGIKLMTLPRIPMRGSFIRRRFLFLPGWDQTVGACIALPVW